MPIPTPELNPGERYIGAIVSAEGIATHIILLPGVTRANWQAAKEWAASIGGDLPNRVEQALLFATAKEEFEPNYHWSNEQHASDSDYAWITTFFNGYQDSLNVTAQLRARAVRRLVI